MQDVAQQARGKTADQLRTQINDRSSQAGDQLVSAAQAMRRTSDQLRVEGNDRMADLVESVVGRSERLGGYLRAADGDKILRDVESFGRRQPWLMVGGSAVVGFLASRFMKASSSGRYHGQSDSNGYPARRSSEPGTGVGQPAGLAQPAATEGAVEGGFRERADAASSGGVARGLD